MAFRIDMDVNEFEKYPDMNLYNYLGFSQAFQTASYSDGKYHYY